MARRTSQRKGATGKDRLKKKADKSKHNGRTVPTPANPRGQITQRPVTQKGGYGSLRSKAARTMNIASDAIDADDRNLRLFKQ